MMRERSCRTASPITTQELVLYLLLALLAAAPVWGPGIINTRGGGDSPFLLQRTLDVAEGLHHGIFPVRWMSHGAYGLGYPFFNHYAALPYYVSGGLTALGLNPLSAVQATQTLGFVLAALAMAFWAQGIFRSRWARLLAVAAYTFAPFHMVNVYVRGDSLSEFYAFVWYPLLLWTLDRVAERPHGGRILGSSCVYGALILTHNISALIFSPFALLYALVAVWRRTPKARVRENDRLHLIKRLGSALLPFVVGVALTAWFWAPAILEIRYGQLGPEFTQDYFHYSNHFRRLDLVQRSLLFDYSIATTVGSAGPFAMGLVQAILATAGTVTLIVRDASGTREGRYHAGVLVLSLLIATVMMTPLSEPLWAHLPLLATTQFPWRFLSVQALFAAAATGALASSAAARRGLGSPYATVAAVAFAVALIAAGSLLSLQPDRLAITGEDITWDRLLFYESFTGNIGTTIRHEYLPRDVVPRLYISEYVVDGAGRPIADGNTALTASLIGSSPTHQGWTVDLETAAPVAFPLNWWPGWRATLDGSPVATYPMSGSGRLTVDLPSGAYTVALSLGPTPLRRSATDVSLAALVAVAGVLFWSVRRRLLALAPDIGVVGLRLSAVALLVSGLGPVALHAFTDAGNNAAVFYDFEQMPYPHRGPIDFEVAELESASLSEPAKPGEVLTVTLDWRALVTETLTATVKLVSPAEPRQNVAYALAEATARVEPTTHVPLPLPDNLSRGLYLVQLRLDGPTEEHRGRTHQGRTMGTLYVGWLRISEGPVLPADAPTLATFRDLRLHALAASQPEPDQLRLEMHWSTPGTPRNWRLSLRLLDVEGRRVIQRDLQPGYGYLPTTLWQPNERVVDYPIIPLPEGLAPGDYTLQIVTYLMGTSEVGGEAHLPIQLTEPTRYDLRDACCEQTRKGATLLCESEGLALLSLDHPAEVTAGDRLKLEVEWNAVQRPTQNFSATWRLVAPDGTTPVMMEHPVAPGSATATWPRHTWVQTPIEIALPHQLDEGTYQMSLMLMGDAGAEISCDDVATVTVRAAPRVFDAPPIPHPQVATFGDTLELLGYDLEQTPETLSLTLWWRARKAPTTDYKRFVHLYAPESEAIPAQDDAMPRSWTYPTSRWAAGEVVSETVELAWADVAAGTYRLGVGWYDPETLERLSGVDAEGQPISGDRVTLETPVRR